MIYKAIWLFLQICFTIIETLKRICCRTQSALRSYDQRRNNNNSTYKEKNFLLNCRTQLSKLPNHLSIIISPEEIAIEDKDILQLIDYALWMKVDFLSLYDARMGKYRSNLFNMELPKHMQVKQVGNIHLLLATDHHYSENISVQNGYTNGYKNGLKSEHFIQMLEVKPLQGHALIADVCRDLFKQRASLHEIKERAQLSRILDEEITKRLWKCKDPELCIVFSKHMCTFGMLPWQMRFTEFYLHQQGSLFDARTFAKILFQYARCEQRWGK